MGWLGSLQRERNMARGMHRGQREVLLSPTKISTYSLHFCLTSGSTHWKWDVGQRSSCWLSSKFLFLMNCLLIIKVIVSVSVYWWTKISSLLTDSSPGYCFKTMGVGVVLLINQAFAESLKMQVSTRNMLQSSAVAVGRKESANASSDHSLSAWQLLLW